MAVKKDRQRSSKKSAALKPRRKKEDDNVVYLNESLSQGFGDTGRRRRNNSEVSGNSRQPLERKRKKNRKISSRIRLILYVLGLAATIIMAILIAAFLLFKVGDVQVVGSSIYTNEEIIAICGINEGDTLAFIPAKEKEAELKAKLPYIGEVRIKRKIPGSVIIEIVGAKTTVSVQTSAGYVYTNKSNKVLDVRAEPAENTLIVMGVTLSVSDRGKIFEIAETEKALAYNEAVAGIYALEITGIGFTHLDLTDVRDIKLFYQNRILFKLGVPEDLSYKIDYGYKNVTMGGDSGISETERGTLNLTQLMEINRSVFTRESAENPIEFSAAPQEFAKSLSENSGGEEESVSNDGASENADSTAENTEGGAADAIAGNTGNGEELPSAVENGTDDARGGGIPNQPFVG